ncbi:hypothetical protein [Hyperthermus butylicus]|uniref:Uncharacterized protein n=1 Tax=Hyperthermus butylicus (strain DSM 5456 / JCM 9403 / PLM1-5) TaxID=415426 RepID=A2BKC7_HYPBU|nr:hypothetical protein [Hyperthermus butylicus]ABM80438.1 hypothetical protein Hbut_0578 [Hyperthermus butylicus DSM 5456]
MVSDLSELETMVRLLRLPYRRMGDSVVASFSDEKYGEIGLVYTLDRDTGSLRVAAPLDVEPTSEGLRVILEENFTSTTYKYALDYEGFITVVYDVQADCVRDVRKLREITLYVVEGAKRILERSRPEKVEGG